MRNVVVVIIKYKYYYLLLVFVSIGNLFNMFKKMLLKFIFFYCNGIYVLLEVVMLL